MGLDEHLAYLMTDNTPHWTLAHYTDFALLLSGSSFTVGIVDVEPLDSTVPTKPEFFHTPTFMSGFVHVTPAKPEPVHVIPGQPETDHIMPAQSETDPLQDPLQPLTSIQ